MLAVILFHARLGLFSGGFVGVDVFFVISGYLITSVILADVDKDRFSLLSFYDRRVRRIFPALFLMLTGTAIIGYWLLLPTEMMLLGRTMAATALFVANIYFWRETGYFAPQADENPLLHTWSLAVEEQFYFVFPLLLILLLRTGNRRWVINAFLAMAAASLVLAEWQVGYRPSAAFYLLPMRAWELLAGAVLALGLLKVPQGRDSAVCAGAGLAMIAVSIIFYDPGVRFPGLSALLPCLGTALLIHAGAGRNWISETLLSSQPMNFIGRISYSLYLWHWPLLIIPTLYMRRDLTGVETAAMIAAAFACATLSWKYVETPIRKWKLPHTHRGPVAAGVMASVAFCAAGVGLLSSGGAPWRYSDKVVLADRAQIREELPGSCVVAGFAPNHCDTGDFDVLVWGDSHAGHYFPGVSDVARSMGLHAQVQTIGGCPPLLGVTPVTVPRAGGTDSGKRVQFDQACEQANGRVMDMITQRPAIRTVVLAAAWSFWTEGNEIGTGEGRFLTVNGSQSYDRARNRLLMRQALEQTVRRLQDAGVRVVLMGQVPESTISPSWCIADAYRRSASWTSCAPERTVALKRLDWSRQLLASVAGTEGKGRPVYYFDPVQVLCRQPRCLVEMEGRPIYRDADHLTRQGAVSLSRYFRQEIASAAAGPPRRRDGELLASQTSPLP